MSEFALGLQEYEWDDGEIVDTVCPFCLDEIPDYCDPIEFWEPTECCHACCSRCSKINLEGGWSLCPSCAAECEDYDLLT
jgi:hypothetical protein